MDSTKNSQPHIVIVGGGSAAWITASYLKNSMPCDVTVIHNGKREIIGVGESTTPAVSLVAKRAGIPFEQWLREARATIKYGILFKDFESMGSRWYHLFDDAINEEGRDSAEFLLDYRRHHSLTSQEFNLYHGAQQVLFEKRLAPFPEKVFARPGFSFHVEAAHFGEALKNHLKDYKEIIGTVDEVRTENNKILSLILENGDVIKGDLYVDATGFERKLISELSIFEAYPEIISNRFIAGVVKPEGKFKHLPYTVVHAHPFGWIWEIDSYERKATGFIYSSQFTKDEDALEAFHRFWNHRLEIDIPATPFVSGAMKDFALGNCISTGLAQSFIEPLEATSLATTCMTAFKIVEIFQKENRWGDFESKVLNRYIQSYVFKSRDFVKFHYTLSKRNDSDWWKYWSTKRDPKAFYKFCQPYFENKRYCLEDDSIINHSNLASMMIGFGLETPDYIPRFERNPKINLPNYDHFLQNEDLDDYLYRINRGL